MSQGYSLRLRDLNNAANESNLGVRLGRACIARDIPVIEVAKLLGVTRATVYNWFSGASAPLPPRTARIEAVLASLQQ